MGVDSYLELFTTFYGWTISNLIFSILVDTGLVFIPLIVTVIAVWQEAHVDGTENGGPEWAIRKLEVELIASLFVMSVAFVPSPFTTLDRLTLTYRPTASSINPSPPTVNTAGSGTSYDSAFNVTSNVPVPLWWYMTMGLSSGVNNAVRAGIANDYIGLREAENAARFATLENPDLRLETQRFIAECYHTALSLYRSAPPSAIATAIAADPIYAGDLNWIGSRTLREDPNLYAAVRAKIAVDGFANDPSGDDMESAPGETTSVPNCKRWWEDPTIGLRQKLVSSSGTGFQRAVDYVWGVIRAAPASGGVTLDLVQDKVLAEAVWRTHSNYMSTSQVLGEAGQPDFFSANPSELKRAFGEIGGTIGLVKTTTEATLSYYPVAQFMTMAQPLILMAIYIFLPLAVVFSRFSLKVMLLGALAIFTVKFWAAMFTIAHMIDQRLIVAMYPEAVANGSTIPATVSASVMMLREFFTNGVDGGAKRMVLNILTMSLFFLLPVIWSSMMAWAGFAIGKAFDAALSRNDAAGKQAGSVGLSVATPLLRR
jgi:TraG-like protein, N-terminal region